MSCFNPITLRAELATLLGSHLGTYRTSDGQEFPAIRVMMGGQSLPHGWKVSGAEAIIQYLPEGEPEATTGNQVTVDNSWIIRLVAWGDNASLYPVIDLLIRRFPRSTYTVLPQMGEQFPREQAVFKLRDYSTLRGILN